jgi:hypothetical protein
MMALSYLPEEHIPTMFLRIRRRIPRSDTVKRKSLDKLADYIEKNWVSATAFFPPSAWSVFKMPVRLNTRARRCGKYPLYQLLDRLSEEVQFVPLQRKLLAQGKLHRRQRANCRRSQEAIFEGKI